MQPPTLEIRRFRDADLDDVKYLHQVALEQVGAWLGPGKWNDDIEQNRIAEVYYESGGEFLVGFYDGKLAAMGAFKPTGEREVEIKRMRVLPEYQGRGFGQQLLEALEQRARELGITRAWLDTSVLQSAAQKLYIRNGYREYDRIKIEHLDCILFEKSLEVNTKQ
jgi:ribosomal protein S18 acetylase RimI-like enzyme